GELEHLRVAIEALGFVLAVPLLEHRESQAGATADLQQAPRRLGLVVHPPLAEAALDHLLDQRDLVLVALAGIEGLVGVLHSDQHLWLRQKSGDCKDMTPRRNDPPGRQTLLRSTA